MQEPRWPSRAAIVAIHDRQLAEHGGLPGLRDEGLLESALARPRNLFAYSEDKPDIPALAASYTFGLASNHPFLDGNKRIAMIAGFLFAETNSYRITASEQEAYITIMKLAAGELGEQELAAWFRENTNRDGPAPAPRYNDPRP